MGFTKRFLTKEMIISKRRDNNLVKFLSVDGIICLDDFSHQMITALYEGATENDLKKMVDDYIHLDGQ